MFILDNVFTPCCEDCIINSSIQNSICKYTLDKISYFSELCLCLQIIEDYLNKWYSVRSSADDQQWNICIIHSKLIFIYCTTQNKWIKSKFISSDNSMFQVIDSNVNIPFEYNFGTYKILKNYNIFRWIKFQLDTDRKGLIDNIIYKQLKTDFYKYYFKEEIYEIYTCINLTKKRIITHILERHLPSDIVKYIVIPFVKNNIIKIKWCYSNKKDIEVCYEKFKQILKDSNSLGLIRKKSNNYLLFA